MAALRWACASLVALPLVFALGGPAGVFPSGDAVVFEPGGELLVEILRIHADDLAYASKATAVLAVAMTAANLAAAAALLVALASRDRLRPNRWLSQTADHWPAFVGLGGVTFLAACLVALAIIIVEMAVALPIAGRMDQRNGDLLVVAVALAGVAVVAFLGAMQDLARAARVAFGTPIGASVRRGLCTLRTRPVAVLIGWLAPALWSLAVILGAAWLVSRADLERGTMAALLAVALVHALGAVSLTFLRAVWFARALRLVVANELSGKRQAPVDTPADSGAPADPSSDPAA